MSERELTYGWWEGVATIYEESATTANAWMFVDGSWKEAPLPDVLTKSAVISKKEFDDIFGHLPVLPNFTDSHTGGRRDLTPL